MSLVPNAILNALKYVTIRTSIISVVKEKNINVFETPWVKADSFLVLQTKKFKIWPQTTPIKYPVCAYLQASVVKQTGRLVYGEICWILQLPQLTIWVYFAWPPTT